MQQQKISKSFRSIVVALSTLVVLLASCERDHSSDELNPSFKVNVNGAKQSIDACGTSDHVAEYLKDTAVFVGFGCGGQGIGFYLKGAITDGVYQLDEKNQAWYENNNITYRTDAVHTGTLTIRTSSFQAPNGVIPYITGEISFDAIDNVSGNLIKLNQGTFVLKKYSY